MAKVSFFLLAICAYVFCTTGTQAKKDLPLSERVQQLTDGVSKKAILRFNGEKFRQYVKATPRNYSVIIMFTALAPSRQCGVCRQAHDEFQLVANSYRYSPHWNQVFFAMVDADDATDVFRQLSVTIAPTFMHFPKKGKPEKRDTMDLSKTGFDAEFLARWVGERTDIRVKVHRPPNYFNSVALFVVLILIVGLLYLHKDNLSFFYNNNSLWGLIAIAFTLTMISGQMWNRIRGAPFMRKNNEGDFVFFERSSQRQLIFETYIVAMIYSATVVGMVLMTEAARKRKQAGKRKMMAIFGLGFLVFFFSLQLSLFRSKVGRHYPYRFLLE